MLRNIPAYFVCLLVILACLSDSARAVPVTVKVVGPDAQPVAGARVWVWPRQRISPKVTEAITAQSDASGVATLDLPPRDPATTQFGNDEADVIATVSVYAPGFALDGTVLKVGENTLRLERATALRGRVQDAQGKPVAGVPVVVEWVQKLTASAPASRPSGQYLYIAVPNAWQELLTARTDANGQWQLEAFSANAKVQVLVQDPRFALTSTSFEAGNQQTTNIITVVPAANITGRVIFEDGRPAPNVSVKAFNDRGNNNQKSVTTDANGDYRITGLAAGSLGVMLAEEPTKTEWVAAPVSNLTIHQGETVTAPNLVLTKGGMLEGHVVDAETGAGIPYVYLAVAGSQAPRFGSMVTASTDETGKFTWRVVSGDNAVMVWQRPPGYLQPVQGSYQQPLVVNVPKGETKSVEIKLKKGLNLSGVVVDGEGKPVPGVSLTWRLERRDFMGGGSDDYLSIASDPQGQWSLNGVRPGVWTLSASGEWDIQEPKTFEAKANTPADAPLKIVIKRISLATITGRVETSSGQPVAGLRVVLSITERRDNTGIGYGSQREVVTDETGQWKLEGVRPNVTNIQATVAKPGYKYMRGGTVEKQGDTWITTAAVMLPLQSRIMGRVVDARNQPIAGAKVLVPEGGPDAVAISDAKGQFEVTQLPEGEITLVAMHTMGTGTNRVRTVSSAVNAQSGASVILKPIAPPTPKDVAFARQVLEDAWETSRGVKNYYDRSSIPSELATIDPDAALDIARDNKGKVPDSVLSSVILTVARTNAKRAAQWAPEPLSQIENVLSRATTGLELGQLVVKVDPVLARKLYEQGRAAVPEAKETWQKSSLYTSLAQLDVLLQIGGAADWFHKALDASSEKTEGMNSLAYLAENIAEVNTEWAEEALAAAAKATPAQPAYATPLDYAQMRVVQVVARRDPEAARKLLERFQKEMLPDRSEWNVGQAQVSIIRAIGPKDPAGAVALARTVRGQNKAIALLTAAQWQPREAALALLREAFNAAATPGQLSIFSQIAARAFDLDPKVGREMFDAAHVRFEAFLAQKQEVLYYGSEIASFAYDYRHIDPLESRLILEREFARVTTESSPGNDEWMRSNLMETLVTAMATVDVDRALQMTWDIPITAQSGPTFSAQRKIARYLLADENTRRTAPFRTWIVSRIGDEREMAY